MLLLMIVECSAHTDSLSKSLFNCLKKAHTGNPVLEHCFLTNFPVSIHIYICDASFLICVLSNANFTVPYLS